MKVKKVTLPAYNRLDHRLTGTLDELTTKGKKNVLSEEYNMAMNIVPDYDRLKKEIEGYLVALPESIDIQDLSKINELYAHAQSYFSRVTAIEIIALDNLARWQRLYNLMESIIEDKESELLISEEVRELSNQKQQAAMVRTKLKKEYKALRQIEAQKGDADSFRRITDVKKKDLNLVLTTLGKQVKALSVEQHLNR